MGNSIRANWHLGDLDLPDDTDPMQELSELQSAGNVIDLSMTPEGIQSALSAELRLEGRVTARGDGCDLKWEARHALQGGGSLSCYNCPHFSEGRLICRIGRKQTDLLEQQAALRMVGSLDAQLAAAHARDFDASAELAEAVLA